jgi:hypothetical protein
MTKEVSRMLTFKIKFKEEEEWYFYKAKGVASLLRVFFYDHGYQDKRDTYNNVDVEWVFRADIT